MKFDYVKMAAAVGLAVVLMTGCAGGGDNSDVSNTTGGILEENSTSADVQDTASEDNNASAADYEYTVEGNGVIITKYVGKDAEIVIPSQIEGKDVVKLAFSFLRSDEEKQVTSVVMSDTITELNAELFSGNHAVKSITFSKGLKEIPKKVCQNASALETVVLPDGLEVIGFMAFNNCDSIKEVVLPDSLKELSVNAFFACDSLETMTYKGTSYGKTEFDSCYSAVNNQ